MAKAQATAGEECETRCATSKELLTSLATTNREKSIRAEEISRPTGHKEQGGSTGPKRNRSEDGTKGSQPWRSVSKSSVYGMVPEGEQNKQTKMLRR